MHQPGENSRTASLNLIVGLLLPLSAFAGENLPHSVGVGIEIGDRAFVEGGAVVHETDTAAALANLWSNGREGGLKLSWNTLVVDDEDNVTAVRKLFAAYDQGRHGMSRLAFGAGAENEHGFIGAYWLQGISGARREYAGTSHTSVTDTLQEDGSRFIDTTTSTTLIRSEFRVLDHGMGVRAGRHFDTYGFTVSGGADYEWGRHDARRTTLALELEKRLTDTPVSVALRGETSRAHDPMWGSSHDDRVWVVLRYHFGKGHTPAPRFAPTSVSHQAARDTAPSTAEKVVTTVVPISAETHFGLNSATLNEQGRAELEQLAGTLKSTPREQGINVTGHTCDLGDARYNLGLSNRRAVAVTDFLVSLGIARNEITSTGMGETAPRYPNTPKERARNRRVEISYRALSEQVETVTLPAIHEDAPPAEPTQITEPAWVRRALRNALPHKYGVSGYSHAHVTTTTETSREIIPAPEPEPDYVAPVAADDKYSVPGIRPSRLNVLTNDYDANGLPIRIVGFTQPEVGFLELAGDELLFTPYRIFTTDLFSYTIENSAGLQSSATVTLIDP